MSALMFLMSKATIFFLGVGQILPILAVEKSSLQLYGSYSIHEDFYPRIIIE